MSINGSGSTFIPFTLSGLTSITASNSNIGDATATSLTMTTATPNRIARFNGSQQLVSSTVDVSDIAVLGSNNTFSTGFTNNLNGAIKTVNNPLAINNAGINAETISAIVPSTYTLVSGFYRFVSPSSLTGSMQFPNAFTYGTTPFQKYILTLTNCSTNGTDPVTATVYNATTGLIISDATQTITSTAETVTFTFMTGTSPSIIYLEFSAGAINYFVQWSALSVQQCNTEVLSNLVLDAPIISNMTQSPGTTTNLAGGLLVSQTSTGVSASTFTQTGMPASAPTSTLTFSSPTYTLTATGSFATWLGAGTTYITGAKYTFNFGVMFGSQALQLQVVQYNVAGSAYVDIGDIPYSVSKTSSTISGSFTAGLNPSYLGSIVFFFTPTNFSQNVKFNTFTMTRADTQITGITTIPSIIGTAVSSLGLNSSNQIITSSAVPTDFSAVSVGYVPYESAPNTFSNSLMTVGTNDLGYGGSSFTASTGIGSITFSSPTYTANSNASFQGIINASTLPTTALNTACIATFTGLSFPLFAVAPYPYFTLTCGATVVYTSAVGASGTITMPFIPTSTTLFITIYFKSPPTGVTVPVLSWTNFTITTASMITTGYNTVTGRLVLDGTGATEIYNGRIDAYNATGNNNLMIRSWWGIGFPSYDNIVRIAMDTRTGNANFGGTLTTGNLTVSGTTIVGNRFLGTTDTAPTGNFWIGLNGSGSESDRLAIALVGNQATGAVSEITLNKNVVLPTEFKKVGGASGTNSFSIRGTDALNSPYLEFFTANVRRSYIGFATATSMNVFAENGAVLQLGAEGVTRMTIQTNGSMTHTAGDLSYMRYGANSTWGAFLTVGATPDRSGANNAQVITTNGNLHMDAGNSNAMFYGYYASQRGTPNPHYFYGSDFFFSSGLPQQNTTAIAPICFNGSQAFRSANINHIAYSNNNVAWSGGTNITYAFYRTNGYVSTSIHGKFSYYVGGGGMAYPAMRIYSQNSGLYYYYDLRAYTNVTYNHATFPFEVLFTSNNATTVGWFDVYFYQNGGVITDGNDQLWVICNTSMTNQFV
jgi:hypothetical protein